MVKYGPGPYCVIWENVTLAFNDVNDMEYAKSAIEWFCYNSHHERYNVIIIKEFWQWIEKRKAKNLCSVIIRKDYCD